MPLTPGMYCARLCQVKVKVWLGATKENFVIDSVESLLMFHIYEFVFIGAIQIRLKFWSLFGPPGPTLRVIECYFPTSLPP